MALALLATAGCWTSSAPPASPAPAITPVLPTTRSPGELAAELAAELRAPDDSLALAQYIDRAVVVLDLESQVSMTLCDAQALGPAAAWADMLADPDRREPRCFGGRDQRFSCVQHGPENHDTLILSFRRGETWTLLGVSAGPWPAHDEDLLRAHRARLDAAVCP